MARGTCVSFFYFSFSHSYWLIANYPPLLFIITYITILDYHGEVNFFYTFLVCLIESLGNENKRMRLKLMFTIQNVICEWK